MSRGSRSESSTLRFFWQCCDDDDGDDDAAGAAAAAPAPPVVKAAERHALPSQPNPRVSSPCRLVPSLAELVTGVGASVPCEFVGTDEVSVSVAMIGGSLCVCVYERGEDDDGERWQEMEQSPRR